MKKLFLGLMLISFSSWGGEVFLRGYSNQTYALGIPKNQTSNLTINGISVAANQGMFSIQKYIVPGKNKIIQSSSSHPLKLKLVRYNALHPVIVNEQIITLKEFNSDVEFDAPNFKADEKIEWNEAEKKKLYEVLQDYRERLQYNHISGYVMSFAPAMKEEMKTSPATLGELLKKEIARFDEVTRKTKVWKVTLPEMSSLNCSVSRDVVTCTHSGKDSTMNIESSNGNYPIKISFKRINGTYVPAQATCGL